MNMAEVSLVSRVLNGEATPCEHVTLSKVLLATDFSESSTRALDYALGIADRYQAQLLLFHCLDPLLFDLAAKPGQIQKAFDDAHRNLQQVAQGLSRQHRARNVEIKVVAKSGDFGVTLPQVVHDLEIGLIVIGTHGRTGWKKLLLGSVAEAMIDYSPCPVLTVGPSTHQTRMQHFGPKNILLATASSDRYPLVEAYACSLARKSGARLSVINVIENNSDRVIAEISQFEWYEPTLTYGAAGGQQVSPQHRTEIGTRGDLILKVAEQTAADLIVLGVPAGHKFTDRFLSTDSYQVVCGSPCPVLAVRGK
jgi:nucleotide-binding universal stress UspA family protein